MLGRMASLSIALLVLLGTGVAQEEPYPIEPQQEEPDPRDVRRPATEDPASSVTDSNLRSRRNRYGVALGAYEAYSTNLYATSEGRQGDGMTVLSPRVFANFGSRRSRFHADYRYGYRFYNRFGDLNTDEHQLNLDYSALLAPRITFLAYERLDNSVNDSYSMYQTGFGFAGPVTPSLSSPFEFLRGRQKVLRNDSALGLGFQVARKGRLSVTTGYQTYRYNRESFAGMNGAYASVSYSHEIRSWLNVSSSYMTYFTDVDARYRDRQIHSVQVGNFSFKLSRSWRASFGGGVDYSNGGHEYGWITTGSGGASLSRNSRSNTFSLAYRRGLSAYFGQPGIFASNYGTISFLQRISRKMSAQASGYYQRGNEYRGAGRLEYYGGIAGLEYGLRPDLVASINYSYRNQRTIGTEFTSWAFDRSVVYAGLTYLWPSRQ